MPQAGSPSDLVSQRLLDSYFNTLETIGSPTERRKLRRLMVDHLQKLGLRQIDMAELLKCSIGAIKYCLKPEQYLASRNEHYKKHPRKKRPRQGGKPTITDAEVKRMRAMVEEGWRYPEIGAEFGMSASCVGYRVNIDRYRPNNKAHSRRYRERKMENADT